MLYPALAQAHEESRATIAYIEQARLTQRYNDEFDRYIGKDAAWIETRRQGRGGL